jgi:hypothetical protein
MIAGIPSLSILHETRRSVVAGALRRVLGFSNASAIASGFVLVPDSAGAPSRKRPLDASDVCKGIELNELLVSL